MLPSKNTTLTPPSIDISWVNTIRLSPDFAIIIPEQLLSLCNVLSNQSVFVVTALIFTIVLSLFSATLLRLLYICSKFFSLKSMLSIADATISSTGSEDSASSLPSGFDSSFGISIVVFVCLFSIFLFITYDVTAILGPATIPKTIARQAAEIILLWWSFFSSIIVCFIKGFFSSDSWSFFVFGIKTLCFQYILHNTSLSLSKIIKVYTRFIKQM